MTQELEEAAENLWKKYPDQKPDKVGICIVILDGLTSVVFDWWASDKFVDYEGDVIAWLQIPKYKP